MDYMTQITAWISANLQYIIITLTLLIFLALIVFISVNVKLSRLNRHYEQMMRGTNGVNLEQLLHHHIEQVKLVTTKTGQLDHDVQHLETTLRSSIQKVGMVRFNAFDDTGSDLSFAVALLNAGNDGVVISSIFGRNESRIYAKPIVAGQSSYFLTDEEKDALGKAQEKKSKI